MRKHNAQHTLLNSEKQREREHREIKRGQSEGSSKPRGNEPQAVGVEREWATCSVLFC